jgi:ArsR family transcriptional regulator
MAIAIRFKLMSFPERRARGQVDYMTSTFNPIDRRRRARSMRPQCRGKGAPVQGKTMEKLQVIKALAHPARMDILNWLRDPETHFGDQGHPVAMGVCANQFQRSGLAQSTVSAHLSALIAAGLVTSRRVGQWIFYKRNEEAIATFLKQLTHDLQGNRKSVDRSGRGEVDNHTAAYSPGDDVFSKLG